MPVFEGDVGERPAVIWYAGTLCSTRMSCGPALALAVLSKGLVALVFFFGTALVYLLLTDELEEVARCCGR